MSTAALFDEESSSDDENVAAGTSIRNSNNVGSKNDRIDGKDDSDDDSTSPSSAPSKTTAKKTIFDDESDLEDPVTGTAATTDGYNEDDDDKEFDVEQDGIVGTAERKISSSVPTKPPHSKHMVVLEAPPRLDLNHKTVHMTKLPNLVGIQPTAFDADTYSAKQEEAEYKGFVHNMIRWRYKTHAGKHVRDDTTGALQRETNTHIVKWQDDSVTPPKVSYTLHIGKHEVLELDSHDSSKQNGFAGLNGYLYLSQTAEFVADEQNVKNNVEPGGTVLECVATIQSKFSARPSSLQSEAHKNLTVAVRQKTIKKARIAEYVTQEDPEKAKEEKIKIKSDFDKATSARKHKSGGGGRRAPGMNRRYLNEEYDDEDGNYDSIDIKKLKKRGREEEDSEDYGDSSEESEEEGDYKSRLAAMKKKKAKQDDSEEDMTFGVGDDDSDDDNNLVNRARKSVKKRAAVLDDDSEDDE